MPKKKASPKKVHVLEKNFLQKEQDQFYKDHPNSKMLIGWFMLLFILLTFIYAKKFLM